MADARRFSGGRIFTGRRFVESLLIEDGRVVAAGSAPEVARASPVGVEVEELRGGLVLPGLIDAHLHLQALVRAEEGVPLETARTHAELAELLRAWAVAHPTGPIVGRGWSADQFDRREEPTRRDLDGVVADRPVVLYHASGHAAVVNQKALEAAGYGPHAEDPPAGRLGRGPDGTPDGRLYERALDPVGRVAREGYVPDPSVVERVFADLAACGLTSVGTLNTDLEELTGLAALALSHELPFRVRSYVRPSLLEEVDLRRTWDGQGGAMLDVRGTKSFADGAFGPRTASLNGPYEDRPGTSGDATLTPSELEEVVRATLAADLVPAVHAIGDRALGGVLRAFEGVHPGRAPPRVEHAALVPRELHDQLGRVRPTLVVQPGFVWSDWWLEERLGPERARWAYPFRSLTDRGHRLVGSSDAPYDPPDPWRGLAAAVRRTDPSGRSANPEPWEALSPEQAILLYTLHAGPALGDADLGHLEAGARADLVVLDVPDLPSAVGRGRAAVRSTWRGGERTFHRTGTGPQ